MYKITHGPIQITCNSSDEFERVMDYIRRDLGDQPRVERAPGLIDAFVNPERLAGRIIDRNPWTHRAFSDFVSVIGASQTKVLALLVRKTRATDSELREAVGVNSNQQLAGVLSGLSKQAAACNLPAREVFTIENESKSGETTKTYVGSRHFLEIAAENNWPLDASDTEPSDVPNA